MASNLPIWMTYLSSLGPVVVAAIAGGFGVYIAWRQWKTAHEKVVLDLRKERIETYDRIREVIGEIGREGRTTNDIVQRFVVAKDKVNFLFGRDVQNYIDTLYISILYHAENTTMSEIDTPENTHIAFVRARNRYFRGIIKFYEDFPPIILPYVAMHQKIHSSFGLVTFARSAGRYVCRSLAEEFGWWVAGIRSAARYVYRSLAEELSLWMRNTRRVGGALASVFSQLQSIVRRLRG